MSMFQTISTGYPYGKCDKDDEELKFFPSYSSDHCAEECQFDYAIELCGCIPVTAPIKGERKQTETSYCYVPNFTNLTLSSIVY